MAELKPYNGTAYYLWKYLPSVPAAAVAMILFALLTTGVIWRSVSTRTRFAIPFIIGGIFETVGYLTRIIARDRTDNLILYILPSVLVLVAPALFAASVYMVLSRLARSVHGERHLIIGPRWLTLLFVCGDIFSFLVQSMGGGLMASTTFNKKTAQNIILVGLIIQIVLFGLFAVTAVIFHVRMRRWPSAASAGGPGCVPWQRILFMMYTVSAFIMVRSVFRVVEYVMGDKGYLLMNEWPLYVFDALLMVLTMAAFAWWYPGRLTPPRHEWEAFEGGSNSDSRVMLDPGMQYSSSNPSQGRGQSKPMDRGGY